MTSCALSRALVGPLIVGYVLATLTGSTLVAWSGGLGVAAVTLAIAIVRARRPGTACSDGSCPTVLPLRRRAASNDVRPLERLP